jgi:acyl-lipid omega-6 desaturase (Delta-12 desaturase)
MQATSSAVDSATSTAPDAAAESAHSKQDNVAAAARTGKALMDATRPLTTESRQRSWFELVFTSTLIASLVAVGWSAAPWPVRLLSSIIAGLTTVRLFIVYHDFMHLAVLKKSKVARAVLYAYGVLVMTPPRAWRASHNYHHANTAKIVGSHVGSYMMVTTAMWAKMTKRERFMYAAIRHPLTILFGYFTIFMLGMCVSPFLRNPKKNWDSGLAFVVNWALSIGIFWRFGVATWAFGFFLPLAVSMATGAYLFYAQHNFPEIDVQPRHSWSYTKAALESSSYLKMGAVMNWFTGNIGYHHVHHLNPLIPFYRLPEAMAAIPELQTPPTTSLSPSDVLSCFRLKLWDADAGKMVGYPAHDTGTA